MEIDMKENIKTVKCMKKVFSLILMKRDIKENGKQQKTC